MKSTCLIVAPHPDDETIGAGIWIDRNRDQGVTVLHVTDGSPRDLGDAHAAGFTSRRAYAAVRRRELREALSLVGMAPQNFRAFSYVDKELYQHLPELIARIVATIEELRPSLVLSPAYEGGHPDHDATALAVAAARQRVCSSFQHREYRLYHAGPDGGIETRDFLPYPGNPVEVLPLSGAEMDKKRQMMAVFRTQKHMLEQFPVTDERFRDAPSYDFTHPPHPGMLLYERWGWRISGADWRLRAGQAIAG
jgi:LmbE family N-acetylglucosaminyl deacetylase